MMIFVGIVAACGGTGPSNLDDGNNRPPVTGLKFTSSYCMNQGAITGKVACIDGDIVVNPVVTVDDQTTYASQCGIVVVSGASGSGSYVVENGFQYCLSAGEAALYKSCLASGTIAFSTGVCNGNFGNNECSDGVGGNLTCTPQNGPLMYCNCPGDMKWNGLSCVGLDANGKCLLSDS